MNLSPIPCRIGALKTRFASLCLTGFCPVRTTRTTHFPLSHPIGQRTYISPLRSRFGIRTGTVVCRFFQKTIRLNAASTNMNRTRESTKGCFCSEIFQKRRIKQPCREKFLMRNALRTKVRPYCVKTDWRSD